MKSIPRKVIYKTITVFLTDIEPELLAIWLVYLVHMVNVIHRRLFPAIWNAVLLSFSFTAPASYRLEEVNNCSEYYNQQSITHE
jgi:hypothetical protein